MNDEPRMTEKEARERFQFPVVCDPETRRLLDTIEINFRAENDDLRGPKGALAATRRKKRRERFDD